MKINFLTKVTPIVTFDPIIVCAWVVVTGQGTGHQGRNRENFFFSEGAKSFFLIFFPRCEMLFPGRKFPLWYTHNKFSGFEKSKNEKQKKKKKKKRKKERSSTHYSFCIFFTFPSTIFLLFFSIFTPFHFFLASFFPIGQLILSPGQKSLGALCSPAPHLLRHCWSLSPSLVKIRCREVCEKDVLPEERKKPVRNKSLLRWQANKILCRLQSHERVYSWWQVTSWGIQKGGGVTGFFFLFFLFFSRFQNNNCIIRKEWSVDLVDISSVW